jgi:ABC-2 type transport system permease protein
MITIMLKDLKLIFRDRTALIFLFGLPLVFALVFGVIYTKSARENGKLPPLKITVADHDGTRISTQLIGNLSVLGLHIVRASKHDHIREDVMQGDIHAGLVIPATFANIVRNWARRPPGKQSPLPILSLHLFIDPAETQMEPVIKAAVHGALMRTAASERVKILTKDFPQADSFLENSTNQSTDPIRVSVIDHSTETNVPTEGDKRMPGLIIYFLFFMANSVAVTLITERQDGTLRRILTTPTTPTQLLTGKMMARAIMGMLQVALLIAVGHSMLHLSLNVEPVMLIAIVVCCVFTATGLGLLIATMGRTQEQIQGMTTMALLMMGLFSGCLFPRELLPKTMREFSYLTPHAWALKATNDILVRRLQVQSALPALLVLALFGVVFFASALIRFEFE